MYKNKDGNKRPIGIYFVLGLFKIWEGLVTAEVKFIGKQNNLIWID